VKYNSNWVCEKLKSRLVVSGHVQYKEIHFDSEIASLPLQAEKITM